MISRQKRRSEVLWIPKSDQSQQTNTREKKPARYCYTDGNTNTPRMMMDQIRCQNMLLSLLVVVNEALSRGVLIFPPSNQQHHYKPIPSGNKRTHLSLCRKQNQTMTNHTSPSTTLRHNNDTNRPRLSGEFHCHGDPVLQAILQHDTEADEAERRKALKALYEDHARMMEHDRTGAFLGDHTLWYVQDYLPEPPASPQQGKKK